MLKFNMSGQNIDFFTLYLKPDTMLFRENVNWPFQQIALYLLVLFQWAIMIVI